MKTAKARNCGAQIWVKLRVMSTEITYPEMTIDEIESQFDGEWVLVGDPETDYTLKVTRGKVLCHSVDRDVVYDFSGTLRPGEFKLTATLCNKDIPEGTAVLL